MVVNTPTVTFANGVTVVGMPQANLTALLLGLGGAVADAWNRLSVNTPAVLLNNAGAGIEATVNKAAAGNDASFAFKTGFSARALIGLLGSDDFSFKVSPGTGRWRASPRVRPGRLREGRRRLGGLERRIEALEAVMRDECLRGNHRGSVLPERLDMCPHVPTGPGQHRSPSDPAGRILEGRSRKATLSVW